MLDLSRIATGAAVSDVQPNEAEDLLGAAAQQVAGRLKGRELRIDVAGDDPRLFGRFDFAQTLRALGNLIENAAKYSPPAAFSTATRLRSATRHCAPASVPAGMCACPGSRPIWPAMRTLFVPVATTPCEKPRGRVQPSGKIGV